MCVYNAMPYLSEAIASILLQTHTDFELLIIDNASMDGSLAYIQSLHDDRIRLLCNEKNMGLAYSRTRALHEAKAHYIAIMDADDWAYPDRLAKQYTFMEAHPEITVCGTQLVEYETGIVRSLLLNPNELKSFLLFTSSVANPTILFRKKVVLRYISSYDETMPPAEDYDFLARLSEHSEIQFANMPDILLRYRVFPEKDRTEYYILQKKNADRVRERLIRHLGIQPTYAEMQTHTLLISDNLPNCKNELLVAFEWIQKIIHANTKSKRYDAQSLEYVLALYWFNLCYMACKRGIFALGIYSRLQILHYHKSYFRVYALMSLHYIMGIFFPFGTKRRKFVKNFFDKIKNIY